MEGKSLYLYTLVLLGVLQGSFVQGDKCTCDIEHPQTLFCAADFAFVATVKDAIDGPHYEYREYTVELLDGAAFKGKYLLGDTSTIPIQTPYRGLCGRASLLYETTYLFTGTLNEAGALEFVYCNWVQDWSTMTDVQKSALSDGIYADTCSDTKCEVLGTTSMIKLSGGEPLWKKEGCFFNPVASGQYEMFDCETSYGICAEDDHGQCTWTSPTADYDTCFDNRENIYLLQTGAFAITSKAQCKSFKKQQLVSPKFRKFYRKCLIQFKKYKQSLQNRDMDNIITRLIEINTLEEEEKELDVEMQLQDNAKLTTRSDNFIELFHEREIERAEPEESEDIRLLREIANLLRSQ